MADTLEALLSKAPLSKAQKADLWDAFNDAPDADALAATLKPLGVPTHIKAGLWDLKSAAPQDDEAAFQQWYGEHAKAQGLSPDPEGQSYDYRAAFKAGAKPDASGHWPSQFKQAGHPNEIVGGFNTRTGERVQGTKQASEAELVKLGWDPETAKRLTQGERTWGDTAADVATGVAKGVGSTVFGLGKVVRDYTPVGRISDAILPGAFDQRPPEIVPSNTAQQVGFTGEQVAEFLLPTPGKVGKVANVAKDAAHALVQSGSPVQAGVTGAITAAIPGGKAAASLAGRLETGAQKEMAQALGATKEWAKAEAAKLAPQMLQRGISGSRQAMLETAKATAKRVGANLEAAYTTAAQSGQTVPANIVQGNIQLAAQALKVQGPTGSLLVVPGTERVITKLDELADFVASMGPDIPVDKAAALKRTWDRIVSKAGLFGQKATATATDNADAWAYREAAGAFRSMLNTNPTIAALNAEVGFWTGLKNVLKETEKRTQAQNSGLIAAVSSSPGAVAGAATGGLTGAVIGAVATRQLVKVLQSPYWRTTVAGPAKQKLADALASGSTGRITSTVSRIAAALPAQAR